MSGERRAIESPLWVDFTDRPVPPLKFVLQGEYSPAGIVERSEGLISSYSPWYGEFALDMTGLDAVAVVYVMSKDDETALLMACLDSSVEQFFRFLSGADFGDKLTQLTALHWPEILRDAPREQSADARGQGPLQRGHTGARPVGGRRPARGRAS